jgi:hypothetical protein
VFSVCGIYIKKDMKIEGGLFGERKVTSVREKKRG